jgi:hypothetical protein
VPYQIVYDGQTLSWKPFGKSETYAATSGAPGYQTPAHEVVENLGPVPAGKYKVPLRLGGYAYVIGVKEELSQLSVQFDREESIENMPENVEFGDATNGNRLVNFPHWGCHRVRLTTLSYDNRNVTRPGGFYIHDSTKGYSAGCIETSHRFFEHLIQFAIQLGKSPENPAGLDTVLLRVDYSKQRKLSGGGSTYGGTLSRPWSPSTPILENVDRSF